MLLEFSLGNFRSFNEIQTLDLRATPLKSEDRDIDFRNILEKSGEHILRTVGIYGPNGSGKSNLFRGLVLFCRLVRSSLENEAVMDFASDPFRLGGIFQDNAGFFQVQLLIEDKKYRYGFTLDRNGGVLQEWLFGPAEKNETWYFKRSGQSVESNRERFDEGYQLPLENLRRNTLFLSFVSAYNGAISQLIRSFIANQFLIQRNDNRTTTFRRFENRIIRTTNSDQRTNNLVREGKAQLVLDWLKSAGLIYKNVSVRESSDRDREYVIFEKSILNEKGEEIGLAEFDLKENESAGTQKFYGLIGRLYQKFTDGGVIVADEIDNNFHPSLLQQFIRLFNDPEMNKAGAQLIFTSHDTTLLQPDILRRDQIYFTEKSTRDESILYSLADLKGIRNNSDFARQYLAGFYGALPILHNFKQINNLE